jgi:hypothetical protein
LGEKALDRSEEIKHRYPPTTSAALMESARRMGVELCDMFAVAVVCVSPVKYRSEQRKDQLEAVMRLLMVAAVMFAHHTNDSLERWNAFLLPEFHVAVWNFHTAIFKTPMQQERPP